MAKAIRGEDITLYGGEQVLDFTFIDDTISGITKAYSAGLRGDASGEDFHFVTGTGCSVSELARMIVDQVGSSSKIIPVPANSFFFFNDTATTEKAHRM